MKKSWIHVAADAIDSVRRRLNLKPSEVELYRRQRLEREGLRQDAHERKEQLELEVRQIEKRVLALDEKRKREHGVLARTALREMEQACLTLKHKETQLRDVLDKIADQDLAIHNLDLIMRASEGKVSADEWDELTISRETNIADEKDALKARDELLGLGDGPQRDRDSGVDVEQMVGEIRGDRNPPASSEAEDMVARLKAREPEPGV